MTKTNKEIKEEVKEQSAVEEKKPEFTKEELLAVFDSIMFEGYYEEDVTIKGKLKVKFRSKSAKDVTDISKELDSRTFNLISTLQETRAFLSIVYGLMSYNGRDLSSQSLEERTKFIERLPSAIAASLSEAINKFDRKVDLACVEGEENF